MFLAQTLSRNAKSQENDVTTAVPGEFVEPSFDLRTLLQVLQVMRDGDFTVRMPGHLTGLGGKIADTLNEIIDTNRRMTQELLRVGQVVGKEGQTRQRVRFGRASGAWGDMENSVNMLIDDLLWPTTQVTGAISAVAQGDLLQTVPLEVDGVPLQGEFLRSATIVNTMIEQRASRARSAPTASSAARPRFATSAACGRSSPSR
jgi:methyl-accepting chemotaxis protein